MSKTHNKKRNIALIYEFLVKTISTALVENNKPASSKALKIIRQHFRPGTELYKEFRLINSLIRTTVSSEAVAASILQEAKSYARALDPKELDRQRSLLIRSINHTLGESVYDQHVNEYRMMATIQTLINDWRTTGADLERMARYEDQVVRWLVTEKVQQPDQHISDESSGSARLLMQLMMRKLNEKYAGVLSEEQRSIIRSYAFSTASEDISAIKQRLSEVKTSTLESIDAYVAANPATDASSTMLIEKFNHVREKLVSESLDAIDDDVVTRFMLYTKLFTELTVPGDDNDR